ncbi:S8 family serine peptidase [Candidatus Lokiarchaeum ossiferum]|uniref:S8 family serine peptidase n=1 Tax=Candidatus Lokiarchaeum ossiferum TaxID=2951803 RepID=UPI00352BFE69
MKTSTGSASAVDYVNIYFSFSATDRDSDGLKDGDEFGPYSSFDPDSDDNGILDGDESYTGEPLTNSEKIYGYDLYYMNENYHLVFYKTYYGLNKYTDDTDGDGISDWTEIDLVARDLMPWQYGPEWEGYEDLHPNNDDVDGDGLLDGEELEAIWNPDLDRYTFIFRSHPCKEDTDNDKLSDKAEKEKGTDPLDADSDDDGLLDGAEVNIFNTEPNECIYPKDSKLQSDQLDHLKMINILGVWQVISAIPETDRKTVKIAVIDGDPFDTTHNEFENITISSYGVDVLYTDLNDATTDYHGTACLGLIASRHNTEGIAGIAGNIPLEVEVIRAAPTPSAILGALKAAVGWGAQIISMSTGSLHKTDISILEYIDEIKDKSDCLFVLSAGNQGFTNIDGSDYDYRYLFPNHYNFPNIITVGSLNNQMMRKDDSSYGTTVDIAAPGENLYTTFPLGAFGKFGQTSAATPVVAGVAALLLSYGDLTLSELTEALTQSLTPIEFDIQDPAFNLFPGCINAGAALTYAIEHGFY